jgi:hypothetical protein
MRDSQYHQATGGHFEALSTRFPGSRGDASSVVVQAFRLACRSVQYFSSFGSSAGRSSVSLCDDHDKVARENPPLQEPPLERKDRAQHRDIGSLRNGKAR